MGGPLSREGRGRMQGGGEGNCIHCGARPSHSRKTWVPNHVFIESLSQGVVNLKKKMENH